MGRRLAAIMLTDVVGFASSAQDNEARALARLQENADSGGPSFPFAYLSFGLDSVRDDPRFQALISRFGLPCGSPPRIQAAKTSRQ